MHRCSRNPCFRFIVMLMQWRSVGICIASAFFLSIVIVESYLMFTDSKVASPNLTAENLKVEQQEKNHALAFGDSSSNSRQHGPRTFSDIVKALQFWDENVGCKKFRAKYEVDFRRNKSVSGSLQDPDAFPCEDLKLSHVSVLVKSWTWIPDALENLYSCKCGLTCLWTKSPVLADTPEAHLYESQSPPLLRRQGEPLRIYLDLEPGRNPSHSQDIFVTYHAGDDVQATYAGNSFQPFRSYHISSSKQEETLVYWSSSRCLPQRQNIARGILAHVSHHSFGKCLNNVGGLGKELVMYPECEFRSVHDSQWFHVIHCTMSHYKFALAIENTMTDGYVTEKLFYALDVGAVPIYFGAPDVFDFVPPNSIIDGSKFSSMESLASYVKQVASDPLLYAEFHAWRHCGVVGNYAFARAVGLDTLPCRLCTYVSKLGGKAI